MQHLTPPGYLTSADWRWCFAINLPVGVLALVVTFFVLRKELLGPQPIAELDETAETGRRTKFGARIKTIDVGGQLLFLSGSVLVILALTWGGVSYSWNSAAVLASLIIGVLLVAAFLFWEWSAAPGGIVAEKLPWQKPMIPWNILTNRDIGLIFYIEIANGMCMYAVCVSLPTSQIVLLTEKVLYFCNIYFIGVQVNDNETLQIPVALIIS